MTTRRMYQVTCDQEGCPTTFLSGTGGLWLARRDAAQYGWTSSVDPTSRARFAYVDYCPDHHPTDTNGER